MPYQKVYRISYLDNEGNTIIIDISDTTTGTTTDPDYTFLTATANPLVISTYNTDREKFKAIRGKQASISFYTSDNIRIKTFSIGADDRFHVKAFVDATGSTLFEGFLVMDDHSQGFQDAPEPVTLTATDNLGLLKDVPLTKPDETVPKGKHKIIEYISWALQKTGLQLDIMVANTWMEESFQNLPAWDNVYLDAKTFEKEIGACIDCYSALEYIFSWDCFLCQRGGKWWIGHIDEITSNNTYVFQFDYEGNYIGEAPIEAFKKTIGRIRDIKFVNEDAVISFVRPKKSVNMRYNYQFPLEIVDNIDFSRGAFNGVILPYYSGPTYPNSGSFPGTGDISLIYKASDSGLFYKWTGSAYEVLSSAESPVTTAYDVADWTFSDAFYSGFVTSFAYIKRQFINGYEKERYLVMKGGPAGHQYWLSSNPFPVGRQDKFIFSVDARWNNDISGSDFYAAITAIITLQTVDGKYYNLFGGLESDREVRWQGPFTDLIEGRVIYQEGYKSEDQTEWRTISVVAPPLPASGTLTIRLVHQYKVEEVDRFFANLTFQYEPFINGSYAKYKGHVNALGQSGNFKATIDAEAKLGDSPRPLFKGSMFKLVGGQFKLTERWYAGGDLRRQGILPPIPDEYLHPFGHLQAYAVWNQYNRPFSILEGTVFGQKLDEVFGFPDLMDGFIIDAPADEVINNIYMLSDCDQDLATNESRLTLMETYNDDLGKVYSDPLNFTYIASTE
jgi:hypothetical protein